MSKTVKIDLSNPSMPRELALNLACLDSERKFILELDEQPCFPNKIVPIVALADEFRRRGGEIAFSCPIDSYVGRVCGPYSQGPFAPENEADVSAPFDRVWTFSSAAGQHAIFNSMLLQLTKSAVLGAGVKQAFMWCLNEVMDNVLNHSSPDGNPRGYVMAQYHRKTNCLTVCVFDLGIGLKKSFEGSRYEVGDSHEAICRAVEAEVTSGNGQGNGLWGLRELLALAEDGTLLIGSGNAAHRFSPSAGIDAEAHYEELPGFPGTTLVDFQLKCGRGIDFDKVFGKGFQPVDVRQEDHELEDGVLTYKIGEISTGTGSRESGREARNVVENAIDNQHVRVVIDFAGIDVCSSSFIDELVGKLLVKYGFLKFTQVVSLINVSGLSSQLVNRTITQRLSAATDAASA